MGMADIKMGLSFWAFVGYTLLLIKMISLPGSDVAVAATVRADGGESWIPRRAPCRAVWWAAICGALNEQDAHSCVRCGITCTAASRVV